MGRSYGRVVLVLAAAVVHAGCVDGQGGGTANPAATTSVTRPPLPTIEPTVAEPTASISTDSPEPTAETLPTPMPSFLPAALAPISFESVARLEAVANLPAENGYWVLLSPSGDHLATVEQTPAEQSWSVQLWDLANGRPTHRLPGGPAAFFSLEGTQLATLTLEGGGTFWAVDSGVGQRIIAAEHIVALSPDWRLVASTPEIDATGETTTLAVVSLVGSETGWSAQVGGILVALAFSPDGRWLAATTGGITSQTTIWEAATGQVAYQLADVDRLTFSPDGRLAAGLFAPDKAVRLVDTATWDLLPALTPSGLGSPQELAFSADGRLLAASLGAGLAVWDTAGGAPIWEEATHTSDVAFSADGRLLAGLDHAQGVTLWGVPADQQ